MNKDTRFSLTAEEIAFIGRPMSDLLNQSRVPRSVEERVKAQEEVEEFLRFRGPIANYDWRYGSLGQILLDLGL